MRGASGCGVGGRAEWIGMRACLKTRHASAAVEVGDWLRSRVCRYFINSGSTLRLAIHPPALTAPASQVFKHALDQDLERCQSRGIFAACHRAIDLLNILTSRKR
jgi:hypothetical protein